MIITKPIPLIGIRTAPEFFIDGIASIQFMGVNTRYVLFKNVYEPEPARKVEFTAVMATGGLCGVLRQLGAFALEHRIRGQEAT